MYKHAAQSLRLRREHGIARAEADRQPHEIPLHLLDAFREQQPMLGAFGATVKGGVEVSIGKVRGFCPQSECYPSPGANRRKALPREPVKFLIIDITARDLVVSRRRVLKAEALTRARASLHNGSTVNGTVESLMPYGAFVDLGGISGLLHVSRAFARPGANIAAYLSPGENIAVRVLSISGAAQRIALGVSVPLDMRPRGNAKRGH